MNNIYIFGTTESTVTDIVRQHVELVLDHYDIDNVIVDVTFDDVDEMDGAYGWTSEIEPGQYDIQLSLALLDEPSEFIKTIVHETVHVCQLAQNRPLEESEAYNFEKKF